MPGCRRAQSHLADPWIQPIFRDRAAAGRVLAEALTSQEDAVVVGVARGGVAVAVEVAARAFSAPLTAVDVERVDAGGLRLAAPRPPA